MTPALIAAWPLETLARHRIDSGIDRLAESPTACESNGVARGG